MKKTIQLSLLTAVSLILFVVEAQIPPLTPIAGIKLGLANTVTLFIMYRGGFKGIDALLVVIARVLLAALIVGNLFALMFSFTGGVAAVLAMLLVRKALPAAVTSVVGAVTHNLAQITVAVFISGTGVIVYLPVLILGSVLSGLITGFAVTIIIKRIRR
jgi:heptaprenyl diphosphate synthase